MVGTYTTIKVSRKTLQMLDELKRKLNANSYEDVISKLILEYRRRLVESYFGVDKGRVEAFSEEDRGEDREP